MKVLTTVVVALIFLIPYMAAATTWTVPDDVSTICAAADSSADGDTIYVKDGTYNEAGIDLNNKRVCLIGESRDSTIVDGEYSGRLLETTGDLVIVRNFTFKRGCFAMLSGTPTGGFTHVGPGDSIEIYNCTIAHCKRFCENNVLGGQGAAIYITGVNDTYVKIRNSTFHSNKAHLGGAILIGGCTLSDNDYVEIKLCTFYNNIAEYGGSAIFMYHSPTHSAKLYMERNTFDHNEITDDYEDPCITPYAGHATVSLYAPIASSDAEITFQHNIVTWPINSYCLSFYPYHWGDSTAYANAPLHCNNYYGYADDSTSSRGISMEPGSNENKRYDPELDRNIYTDPGFQCRHQHNYVPERSCDCYNAPCIPAGQVFILGAKNSYWSDGAPDTCAKHEVCIEEE